MNMIVFMIKICIIYLVAFIYFKLILKKRIKDFNILDILTVFFIGYISYRIISDDTFTSIKNIFYLIIVFIINIAIIIEKLDAKDELLIIKNGRIKMVNLIKSNYSIETFYRELNKQDVLIKNIEKAYIKNNKLNIILEEDTYKTLVLVSNGKINYNNLTILNKDKKWLYDKLDTDIDNIFLSIYKDNNLYIIKNSDLS